MNRKTHYIVSEYLLINSQMGDEAALQQLVRHWYPDLVNYATRLLTNEHQAKDAVQLALLAMLKDLPKIEDPAAFPKWIYRTLQNKCVDTIRQNQRHAKLQAAVDHQHLVDSDSATDEITQTNGLDILKKLDQHAYQLVYLHYIAEMSLADISDILAIPVGTIKSRLFNIRKQLRHLKGDDYE